MGAVNSKDLVEPKSDLELIQEFLEKKNDGSELYDRHLGLIYKYVNEAASKYKRMNGETDLFMSFANLIFVKAIKAFDPDNGVQFSTYLTSCIRTGLCTSELVTSSVIHIPRHVDLKRDDIQRLKNQAFMGNDRDRFEHAVDDSNPYAQVEHDDELELVRVAISCMPERMQRVVNRCLVEGKGVSEVGREEGISRTRIYQIKEEGMEILKYLLTSLKPEQAFMARFEKYTVLFEEKLRSNGRLLQST